MVSYPWKSVIMNRILIANRGEIAVRIIRACREMGIPSVAVYSEPDRDAPHVRLANEAVEIGPGPAAESYLRMDRILDAAKATHADAIHPGYGFLSENAAFAQACLDAGITFIGPPPEVIRKLGNKSEAKQAMEEAGVPCVPGYHGTDQSAERLMEEARLLETPLVIKAAAGGGGRGMRVVRDLNEFAVLLDEARREALAAFGDDRILLERYIDRPRHVEFQIFGDRFGNAIHLFERECSIQRRHQKILEESPSPALTPELRAAMAESAVLVAKTAGYVNAGTVEFLVEERPDGGHRHYFLEVNARLQVEHPVTETITGLDLVQLQIAVARGEELPLKQAQIQQRGHAIEVRIYAEDPETGFLPSIGPLLAWNPAEGPGVRVDSGVEQNSEVSPYYDPMLAKMIVSGTDRTHAIARLKRALSETQILGVRTNVAYLLAIASNEAFARGATHTSFLSQELNGWTPNSNIPREAVIAYAIEQMTRAPLKTVSTVQDEGDPFSPWHESSAWRNT
jgi:3-methylcrotonyl-CoA carboxylase alpha subunit